MLRRQNGVGGVGRLKFDSTQVQARPGGGRGPGGGAREARGAPPGVASRAVWKSNFYGAFVLNHRVVLHAIDASPARWRGDACSSPLDGASTASSSPRNDLGTNYRGHPTHWLISTQVSSRGRTRPFPRRLMLSWPQSRADRRTQIYPHGRRTRSGISPRRTGSS